MSAGNSAAASLCVDARDEPDIYKVVANTGAVGRQQEAKAGGEPSLVSPSFLYRCLSSPFSPFLVLSPYFGGHCKDIFYPTSKCKMQTRMYCLVVNLVGFPVKIVGPSA